MTRSYLPAAISFVARFSTRAIRRRSIARASVQQTQRYLNVTDEELRKGLEISWKRRMLKAVSGGRNA